MITIKQGHRYFTPWDGAVLALEDVTTPEKEYAPTAVRCLGIGDLHYCFVRADLMEPAPMRYFHGEIPK